MIKIIGNYFCERCLIIILVCLCSLSFVHDAEADTVSPNFGAPADLAVVGDWNGDGSFQVGTYRQGTWFLDNGNGQWDGEGVDAVYGNFGASADLPVAGDWNGVGKTQIGTYRAGMWFLDNGNGRWDGDGGDTVFANFGVPTDIPVTGDWNGDGKTEIGTYRQGTWFLDNGNGRWDGDGVDTVFANFGAPTDIPVTGDWNGDGKTEIGAYRQGTWFLDNGNGRWDGEGIDRVISNFGTSNDMPVSGDWNNDGITDIGFYRQSIWYSQYLSKTGSGSSSPSGTVTTPAAPADVTAPTVSIGSSASGTSFTSAQTVSIAVAAQDNVGVSKVELYDGATLRGMDTAAPYAFSWAITDADNGSHSFTAKAYDAAGNSKVSSVVGLTVDIATGTAPSGPLPVFPGAKGFGVSTPGGRGGNVYKVTNLNDSGAGSLRAAVEATGPRIVVFEVSGTISLASKLNIYNPYLTIAGQTAPSPGITLKGCGFNIRSHDILIQHLRIRVGDDPNGPDPNERDAMQIIQTGAYNVVIDHLSGSWAVDENGSTWASQKDITISNSIFSEGLYRSIHPEGSHSMGFIIGNNSKNVAFIGNLLAHNKERQPRVSGGVTAVIANNVLYNCGSSTHMDIGQSTSFSSPVPDIASQISVAGNVFIPGPNTPSTHRAMYVLAPSFNETTKVYLQDNKIINGTLFTYTTQTDPRVSSPPLSVPNLTVRPSAETEAWVLANVGARPADRDAVDERIVHEVATRTGYIIDSPGQVGGWPTLAKNSRAFPLPTNPNGDDDGDGYTNIEEILQQMAAAVEGKTSL